MTTEQKGELKKHILGLTTFASKNEGWDLKPYPLVIFKEDNNPDQMTSPTGHYIPEENSITLYCKGRSLKDICNTYSHELRHRNQDVQGKLSSDKLGESKNYTDGSDYLKEIEHDAFTHGNVLRRKYTESLQK